MSSPVEAANVRDWVESGHCGRRVFQSSRGTENYHWSRPERRDHYLATRILTGREQDSDWRHWSSDTLIQDLEVCDDPRQGAGSWLASDELDFANELGERLWAVVQAEPFKAAVLPVAGRPRPERGCK